MRIAEFIIILVPRKPTTCSLRTLVYECIPVLSLNRTQYVFETVEGVSCQLWSICVNQLLSFLLELWIKFCVARNCCPDFLQRPVIVWNYASISAMVLVSYIFIWDARAETLSRFHRYRQSSSWSGWIFTGHPLQCSKESPTQQFLYSVTRDFQSILSLKPCYNLKYCLSSNPYLKTKRW